MGLENILPFKLKAQISDIAKQITNHKNIYISENEPTVQDGADGDIWFIITPLNLVLYDDGVESVAWAVGYSQGNGAQSKEAGYLYLEVSDNAASYGDRTYSTDAVVDLTLINTLYFEVETTDAHADFNVRLGVSASKTNSNNSSSFVAIKEFSGTKAKQTYTLDVSELTGSYYVRVAARDTSNAVDRPGKLNVYNVWGEE